MSKDSDLNSANETEKMTESETVTAEVTEVATMLETNAEYKQ